MNPQPSPRSLPILSILDAKVITGPARGLIHLARHLPPGAHLHLALLRDAKDASPLPPFAAAARGARLTVHTLVERSAYDPTVILRARDLARELGARVVQSHSYKPHVIALGVRALYGVPWIGFHHGWTAENAKVKLFHAVDRLTLPRADRVVAVSQSSEHLVLGIGCSPARVAMITNAVDPADLAAGVPPAVARHELGLPPDATVAAAVGRLSHEKGQDVLLRAFARIARDVPSLVVALAGDGPAQPRLEALAIELGVRDRVYFLGHQPRVGRVYAASDLAVLPSRSEGMPNALLEAMCLGIPSIATRVGGVPEVATDGETAWIVPPEDPAALGDALAHAARDAGERARRAARARAHVAREMSPARRAARFMALYRDLLGADAVPAEPTAAAAPREPTAPSPAREHAAAVSPAVPAEWLRAPETEEVVS